MSSPGRAHGDARNRDDRRADVVAVGVDVGGSKLLTLALGPGCRTVAERLRPTPAPAEFVAVIAEEVAAVTDAPVPVGVGAAGLVDRDGVLHFVPHSRGLEGTALRDRLREATGRRVVVENDATAAVWAEMRLGAAVGAADVLFIALGTGIGAGLVSDGRLVRGGHGFAGEVGHMLVDPDGPPCPCGGRGHWEALASGQALDRLARRHGWPSGRALGRAAVGQPGDDDQRAAAQSDEDGPRAGGRPGEPGRGGAGTPGEHDRAGEGTAGEQDRGAARPHDDDRRGGNRTSPAVVLAEYAEQVALGLGALVNVLDPSVVVIGGGVADLGEALLGPLRPALARQIQASTAAGGPGRPEPSVVAAALGSRAGAIGAALLASGDSYAEEPVR